MVRVRKSGFVFCMIMIGFMAGRITQDQVAHAEVRRSPVKQAFESGAERSVKVLDEISQTLHRIEQRVSKIETTLIAPQPRL